MKHYSVLLWALSSFLVVTMLTIANPMPAAAQGLSQASVFERELECLAKNIYFEARGEPFEGKMAVAQVTINRADDPRYPTTICNVVHQKTKVANKYICQFSWVCTQKNAKINYELYKSAKAVAMLALDESMHILKFKDALYFHSTAVKPSWSGKKIKLARVGNHVFYKDRS